MYPERLIRAEGVAVFAAALTAFLAVDGRLWLLLVLALAPDVAMLGYLAGPRIGSIAYNAAHTYVAPLALLGVGVLGDVAFATSVALVWAGHIGADRALGYGLKYPTGFGDTHLTATTPDHGAPDRDASSTDATATARR